MVELGHFALYFSLPVIIYAAIAPMVGVITGNRKIIQSARYAVYAIGVVMTVAAIGLYTAFLTNRFDISYVWQYSNKALPIGYKIAAFYAGQAGSMLFWAWMLSLYMIVVVYQNRHRNHDLMPYVISVTMLILAYFVFIMTLVPAIFTLSRGTKNIISLVNLALLLTVVIIILATLIGKFLRRFDNKNFKEYVLIGIIIAIMLFFTATSLTVKQSSQSDPFEKLSVSNPRLQSQLKKAGYSSPPDGQGLNPMLQNYGMILHPPTLYMGYVGFTIPFAFAIAALLTRKLSSIWIASTRKWTILAWFFLSAGIVLGAQWAYMELGWGGYWAWDPVENASFMPWLTGTAFLHSVMIQERKNMLKVWNILLIIATFALSFFGTFLTRSGILSSVHTFSASSLGTFFLSAIALILLLSVVLLITRLDNLKSENFLESILSRESTFLINNLIFVFAAFAVFWGTIYPVISEFLFKTKPTVGPPFYNKIMVPFALLLFLVTAICPLIAWRRASRKNLRKNFAKPFLTAGIIGLVLALSIKASTIKNGVFAGLKTILTQNQGVIVGLIVLIVIVIVAKVIKKVLYPTSVVALVGVAVYYAVTTGHYIRFILPGLLVAGLIGSVLVIAKNKESRFGMGLAIGIISGLVLFFASLKVEHPWALTAFFLLTVVFTTVVLEFYRGTRIRFNHDKERSGSTTFELYDIFRAVKSFGTLIWKNKRRYGGYIIHIGIVLMFIGITASSTWSVTKEAKLREGESMSINNYLLHFRKFDTYTVGDESNPSKIVFAAKMDVWKQHYKNDRNPNFIKTIEPQKNLYPNAYKSDEENQPVTEIDLHWTLKEDLYVILNAYDIKKKTASFKVLVNPLLVWIWIGGFVVLFGTVIVMWPDVLERKRLAARYGWSSA